MLESAEFVDCLAVGLALVGAERDEGRTLRAGRKRGKRDFAALVYTRRALADIESVGIFHIAFARLQRMITVNPGLTKYAVRTFTPPSPATNFVRHAPLAEGLSTTTFALPDEPLPAVRIVYS